MRPGCQSRKSTFNYQVTIPLTTRTIIFVGYLGFLYGAFYSEPTKMMVLEVNGKKAMVQSELSACCPFRSRPRKRNKPRKHRNRYLLVPNSVISLGILFYFYYTITMRNQ